MINYLGQLILFMPCLYLDLQRVNQNRNCFALCFKHSTNKPEEKELDDFNSNMDRILDESARDNSQNTLTTKDKSDLTIEQNQSEPNLDKIEEINQNEASTNQKPKKIKLKKFKLFNFLFKTSFKYFLFALFLSYFVFNVISIVYYVKVDIPVTDLIPKESYLRKHMVNHQQLFSVGPIIILSFMKPLNYWNKTTFYKIRNFINDAKKINTIDGLFEMNWLQDTYLNAKEKAVYFDECKNDFNFNCFLDTFKESVALEDMYRDDVVYNESLDSEHFVINASRFYIQFKQFFGNEDEVEAMHELKWMALKKYNMTSDDVVIYSSIYLFLEQLDELDTTFISIFMLNLEAILLVSYLLIFDLKSVLILFLVCVSFVVSIVSSLYLFGYSLNIVTLVHFLIVPCFISEFLYPSSYLYLFKKNTSFSKNKAVKEDNDGLKLDGDEIIADKASNDVNTQMSSKNSGSNSTSSNESLNNETPNEAQSGNDKLACKLNLNRYFKSGNSNKKFQKLKLKQLKCVYDKTINHSSFFLLFILTMNFLLMYFCSTYSFKTLYLILISTFINLFLHLYLFYPILNCLFG